MSLAFKIERIFQSSICWKISANIENEWIKNHFEKLPIQYSNWFHQYKVIHFTFDQLIGITIKLAFILLILWLWLGFRHIYYGHLFFKKSKIIKSLASIVIESGFTLTATQSATTSQYWMLFYSMYRYRRSETSLTQT